MSFLLFLVGFVIIVAGLSLAKGVVIPIALAILVTFLLTPIVDWLCRIRLNRTLSAIIVVVLLFGFIGAIGWVVVAQMTTFAADLPTYTDNLINKIAQVRHAGTGGSIEKVQEAIENVTGALEQRLPSPPSRVTANTEKTEKKSVLHYLPSLLESLLTSLMVMVLVIFMLTEHGNLRDRIIAFQGYTRLTLTTKALDEVGRRITRYLVIQSLVNGGFGLLFGVGLFALGIPYAILWGFLAAVLRFVPYVGVMVGAALPIMFSLAVFPGWIQPMMAIGLFLILELTISSIIEPLLYGWGTGISKVALLVAVFFWTWLWGPVGLLLSTPLTVCLSVLGKNIPQLAFLNVLLSDQPAKGMNTYYQRLVGRNHDEAMQIVEQSLKTKPLIELYDTVLVPALSYVKLDREREILTATEVERIMEAMQEIVEDLGTHSSFFAVNAHAAAEKEKEKEAKEKKEAKEEEEDSSIPSSSLTKVRIVACPARDRGDSLALQMFQQLCDPTRFEIELLPVSLPVAELFARVAQTPATILCIGTVAPGGVARTRFLCHQLRIHLPELPIIVGRWGERTEITADNLAILRADGIQHVGTSFRETLDQVMQMCTCDA